MMSAAHQKLLKALIPISNLNHITLASIVSKSLFIKAQRSNPAFVLLYFDVHHRSSQQQLTPGRIDDQVLAACTPDALLELIAASRTLKCKWQQQGQRTAVSSNSNIKAQLQHP
jgi:hypothetical protein